MVPIPLVVPVNMQAVSLTGVESKAACVHLVESITGTLSEIKSNAFQPYVEYCNDELRLLRTGLSQKSWQSQKLAVKTFEDISLVVHDLQQYQNCTRPEIRQLLLRRLPQASTAELDRSIDLALRLWLMLNFQEREYETLRHEATCVQWNEHSTICQRMDELFPKAHWDVTSSTSRLGSHFTAVFLTRVCGVRLEWTTSIHDHLRLDRDNHGRPILRIFPYKHFIGQLLIDGQSQIPCPIPRTLLQETLRSLSLLFPFWDGETISLLKGEKQNFHETGPYLRQTSSLTLADFDHWRDRLLELREILDAPPVSWAQLWRDRRNPQQFWTFWIALFILLLTVLSFIASVIQAWASLKALKLAMKGIS